jgi:hypothetical protein
VKIRLSGIFAAAVLALPSVATAATFDIAADFGGSMFVYGSAVGGTGFTPFPTIDRCADAGRDCRWGNDIEAVVIKNLTAAPISEGTVTRPALGVTFHPSNSRDSVIRFVAPISGLYSLAGAFSRQDVTGNGGGTAVSIVSNAGGTPTTLFAADLAASSYGQSTSFGSLSVAMVAGEFIDFTVNRRGEYSFDSTGIAGTISVPTPGGVPEPESWAMMMIGFGVIGVSVRTRRRVANVTA